MEVHLQTLIDSINDAVVATDTEGRVIIWNPAAEKMFGYKKKEALGKNVDELIGGPEAKKAKQITRRILKRKISNQIAIRYTKEGKAITVSISASPVIYGQYLLGGIAVYKDISDIVQKDRQLEHANRLLRAISDINQTIIQEKNPDKLLKKTASLLAENGKYDLIQFVLVDSRLKPVKFMGHGPKKLINRFPPCAEKVLKAKRSLFIPDIKDSRLCQSCNKKIGSGWAATFLLEHNQEIFGVMHVGNAREVFDQSSEIKMLEEISSDLGFALYSSKKEQEKKQAEKEIKRLQQFYQTIITSLAEGVAVEDPKGIITFVNPSLEKLLGYKKGELLGQHWSVFIADEEVDRIKEKSKKRRTKTREQYETILKTKDGRFIPALIHARSLYAGHKFSGVVSVITDISHLKKIQEELKKSRDEALAASKAKSEFLANMSHEIRTPMNGIIGMIELALQTELTEEQRQFLTAARASAESLLTILNDILDFSKIEARMIELVPVEFKLHDSLTEIVATLALTAHKKGLELLCHVPPTLPERVVGDLSRLRQIILNLVSNAIKFTEKGEVAVEVKEEARTEREIILHFIVRDTGIGIPPGKLESIFQPFVQADASLTRKYGGTGLGLAITSQLVNLMGGKIWVESELGKGSTFHFTVKLGLPEKPEEKPLPGTMSAVHGLKVLIVDDNATNRLILKEMLQSWRMKPVEAANGPEALSLIQSQTSEPFDLFLLDLSMPEMDGFTLMEKIKQLEQAKDIPIVILTSADRVGDFQRAKEMGASAYLVKPIRPSDLLDTIMAIKGAAGLAKKLSEPITEQTLPEFRARYKILLAEDNPINQKVALHLLQKRGHTVTVAENGQEALEKFKTGDFDLILMDVQMPVMNGFEATQKIREMEKETGRHIPVVAMTAHAMKGDREKCLEAGMDDYVSKPLYPEELYKVIERAMTKKK
jgi:PAS domain S-box-containing protein